jgi:hypothetical protein
MRDEKGVLREEKGESVSTFEQNLNPIDQILWDKGSMQDSSKDLFVTHESKPISGKYLSFSFL